MPKRRRNKHYTARIRGLQVREFDFTLGPSGLSWKEKGKAEEGRVSRSWRRIVGYALCHGDLTHTPKEEDVRHLEVNLGVPDRSLEPRAVPVLFGDCGLSVEAPWLGVSATISWKNLVALGVTNH